MTYPLNALLPQRTADDNSSAIEATPPISPATENSLNGYGLAANANYLAKCQVDTPQDIVQTVWKIAHRYRDFFDNVFDAGAGDGRFSTHGEFGEYVGYELDSKRKPLATLPKNARVLRACAFAQSQPAAFELAIGNPPYVRHHDLSDTWRERISDWIKEQTGVRPNGWSNAYLYFIWLALITTRPDGLIVYLVPFDWVTRPAARTLREFIVRSGWQLDVYRFDIEPFPDVLTTACIVVVDKKKKGTATRYFRLTKTNKILNISSPTLTKNQPLAYVPSDGKIYARRGFSSGDQKVFMLNEGQRLVHKLLVGRDVVPAISSLRNVELQNTDLTEVFFAENFINKGVKCWLINSSGEPSAELSNYLALVGSKCKHNATCSKRKVWWQYELPPIPNILYASGFRGTRPKFLLNEFKVVAVGSVCGIYGPTNTVAKSLIKRLSIAEYKSRVVALSRGFTKIEVNQMNGLLQEVKPI
jgi:hypothetical protein